VLQTPGVRSIVSFGSHMVPIPDEELQPIRQVIDSGKPVEPWPYLAAGQRVRVECGPLAGVEGKLAGVRDAWRVVVNVEILRRSVAVQLDRARIVPL
jgi:transcription antitermination factor NusG